MKKSQYVTLLLLGLLVIGSTGGVWTSNQFSYKPNLGARGQTEKNAFDAGLDRIDTRLGKEVWVTDPAYGATLQATLSAIGGTNQVILRVPSGTHNITADLSIPTNISLKVERGAIFSIATGKTLTINGGLEAGLYQVFSGTGTGKVVLGKNILEAYPQWWGAKGDGSSDDTSAFQQMFDAAANGIDINIPASTGYYKLTSTVSLSKIVNINSNHAVLRWEGPVSTGLKFNYDYVQSGLPYLANKKLRGIAFETADKNTRLIWAPYGIKRVTFENCSFIGIWDVPDGATSRGVGVQIDGSSPEARKNWTSDGVMFLGCTFVNLDTCLYLNGDSSGSGGIDSLIDMQVILNCTFEHYRRGIVMNYCHGTVIERSTLMPSAYGYLPGVRNDGGFRVDLTESSGITLINDYFENIGTDTDYAKLKINCGYNANYTNAPIALINCNGLTSLQLKDSTLPLSPIYDPSMPRTAGNPGLNNKKYRVIMVDPWGSVYNSFVETPNLIFGSGANMVLHTPINDNGSTGGLTANWDPITNKALGNEPIMTMEICNRNSIATNNYISFRQQQPGAGNAPDWSHSGADPNYGTEFARIKYNGDIVSKGKFLLDTVKIQKGTGSPEGLAWGSPGDLYLRTDGGAGTTMYVKETGSGTQNGWVAK